MLPLQKSCRNNTFPFDDKWRGNTYLIVKDTMDKAVAKKTDEDIADEEAMRKIQEIHESTLSNRRRGGIYMNVDAKGEEKDSQVDKGE